MDDALERFAWFAELGTRPGLLGDMVREQWLSMSAATEAHRV